MFDKIGSAYSNAVHTLQKTIDLPIQTDTKLIHPHNPDVPQDVRHFMNNVSVLRSTNPDRQTELLKLINQGAEGYKVIDYSNPDVLSCAFGLYLDKDISRFQFETLLDVYHSYHIVTYSINNRTVFNEQHKPPDFYSIFDDHGEVSESCNQLLINQLKWGQFFATRVTDNELQLIMDEIRKLPVAEQLFYCVDIPHKSHVYEILKRAVNILLKFPIISSSNREIKLTMVSASVMHIIGNILFKDSYVPNVTVLGDISPKQMTKSLDAGVRLRTSYIPWSNVQMPGSVHGMTLSSVLGVALHDTYHSMHATLCTNRISDFCNAIIHVIRNKILANTSWDSPCFFGRSIDKESCHAIWLLYEREFYSKLTFAFKRIDLRKSSSYNFSQVLFELFYQLATLFKPGTDNHLDLFLCKAFGNKRVFSPMGLTLLIDFIKNKSKWDDLGFNLVDFRSKPGLDQTSKFHSYGGEWSRTMYDIYGKYQIEIEPYIHYFTGDPVKDYLKYYLLNTNESGLTPETINYMVNTLSEEVLSTIKFRRNNREGTVHLYFENRPDTPLFWYSYQGLLEQFESVISPMASAVS